MFEWGGGCIWCGNEATIKKFDIGPIEDLLPLSQGIRTELANLSAWHDKALDWDCPTDPSPWSVGEFQRFHLAVQNILIRLAKELGADYEIVYIPLGDDQTD